MDRERIDRRVDEKLIELAHELDPQGRSIVYVPEHRPCIKDRPKRQQDQA